MTEHLSLVLAVPSLVAAIAHIYEHGLHHTDCIVTDLPIASSTFVGGVDLASVSRRATLSGSLVRNPALPRMRLYTHRVVEAKELLF